jgi:predicted aspartyl protease
MVKKRKAAITGIKRVPAKDMTAFLVKKGYDAIPIRQSVSGLLLIKIKVNGIAGSFILDTGASVSVVESKQAKRLKLTLQKDNTSSTGVGAGGKGLKVIPSTGNKIKIGKHVVPDLTLAVMSLGHVNQALKQAGAHEPFLGVIGVDILKPGKAVIDYSTMTLYLLSDGK